MIERAARAGALGAMAVALMLSPGVAAHAAGPSWLEAQRIESGQAAITGLSCASPTTCAAASAAPIIQDDGLSYEPATDPDPAAELNAVSCAPGTHFCMFADNEGGAFSYDNGSFSGVAAIDAPNELDAVSCPTSTFCMAIDHNDAVFKYASGTWSAATSLTHDGTTPQPSVSCSSATFCVAAASVAGGERYSTYNGTTWAQPSTLFDTSGSNAVSVSCTAATFCLETDASGNGSVYNGSSWSTTSVDAPLNITTPVLYSSCVGTSCVAVDFYDNAFATSNGTTWSPNNPANLHADTGISGIGALGCATATLCVAGDGIGDATTYAPPPAAGLPALAGTPTVGQTLTLAHAASAESQAWYYDDWRRCDNPDAGCTFDPISTSPSAYTLLAGDGNKYLDVREVIGFGFDEEGPLLSNIVGPISDGSSATTGGAGTGSGGTTTSTTTPTTPTPATATVKRTGSASTSRSGITTVTLSCSGALCRGKVSLSFGSKKLGSAGFVIVAGHTAKIKIKLNATARKLLRKHKGRLAAKLTITPVGERATSQKLTLVRR